MAEYIDREQLLELINEDCKYQNPTNEYTRGCNEVCDWAIKTIKNIPSADVVPKSEVERLKEQIERLQSRNNFLEIEYKNQGNLFWARVNGVKSEVAREIFEEIDILGTYNPTLYAELKKKYTESGDNK